MCCWQEPEPSMLQPTTCCGRTGTSRLGRLWNRIVGICLFSFGCIKCLASLVRSAGCRRPGNGGSRRQSMSSGSCAGDVTVDVGGQGVSLCQDRVESEVPIRVYGGPGWPEAVPALHIGGPQHRADDRQVDSLHVVGVTSDSPNFAGRSDNARQWCR